MANIVETIKSLPPKNLIIMLIAIGMAVAGVVFFMSWIQQADYQVLFANLAESDAGGIVQKLKELKVPYKLEAGSIMVPADKVYDLRLQLAAQGLPHGGGVGFELFDKADFGSTDFVQKLNYRRALQGELSRTIMSLAEVEQCRIHLAIPEKSLFVQEGNNPSASVLVKLRAGRNLTQGQIQGIVHLVSSSIEGLNPKDVTVVDSRGDMLTRPSGNDVAGLSSSQLEYQHNVEKDLESRVISILEPVVGRNKIRAKVAAAIDFTKVEKTEEKYDPDGQVIRSEQKNIEKTTAAGSGGVPGVASNLPGRSAAQTGGTQAGSQKQNETTNYEISKVTSHTVNASGDLKKVSIAVIVDGTYAEQEGSKEKKYAPRTEEDLKKYEDIVKKSIGFTASRGDEVRIANMPFETIPQEDLGQVSKSYMPMVMTAARYIVPILALLLFFLFVVKPLMGTVTTVTTTRGTAELPLPRTVAEIEKSMSPAALPPMQNDVIDWAKKKPDQAASLIKTWIEER
ncbi:MAG: flagellar M-ring protein FliF [Nitrospirae bacterium]|nr:flagellar M-ring protein FliF [Nitrospirota bacterium]